MCPVTALSLRRPLAFRCWPSFPGDRLQLATGIVSVAGGPLPGDRLQLATGLVRFVGQLVPGAGLPSVTGDVQHFAMHNLNAAFKGLP